MSYKKLFVAVCLVFGLVSASWAQGERNGKVTVVLNSMSYAKKDQKQNVSSVLGAIADAVFNGQVTQQQKNYDDVLFGMVLKGLSMGHRIQAIDGTRTLQDVPSADYYVDVTVADIATTTKVEETGDKKKTITWYKSLVSLVLHVKDVRTDKVVASPSFTVSDWDASWMQTAEESMSNTLESLSRKVGGYFCRWLPLYANILEGENVKNDKQKGVYIDLGSAEGAYAGLHFAVYVVKTVGGKEAKRQIGKLKITEVQGDEVSLCKVQSGGKEIKAALDAGENISVRSID